MTLFWEDPVLKILGLTAYPITPKIGKHSGFAKHVRREKVAGWVNGNVFGIGFPIDHHL